MATAAIAIIEAASFDLAGRCASAMRARWPVLPARSCLASRRRAVTAQQADELRALGCEDAQGFYFSQAVDTTTAGKLIDSQPWQTARNQHVIQ